jgi:hypothetical protein
MVDVGSGAIVVGIWIVVVVAAVFVVVVATLVVVAVVVVVAVGRAQTTQRAGVATV